MGGLAEGPDGRLHGLSGSVPAIGSLQKEIAGYCSQCGAAVFRIYKVGDRCPGKIKFQCSCEKAHVVQDPPLNPAVIPSSELDAAKIEAWKHQTSYRYPPRPSWDQYFMGSAEVASLMSTCLHRHEGAVAVIGKRIIATGYNGAPAGLAHCDEAGCSRDAVLSGQRLDICRAVHAEENVLLQCAQYGPSCRGATIYTTLQPCLGCAKSMVNAGIKRVVWLEEYSDRDGVVFLQAARVQTTKLLKGINWIDQFDI